MPLSKHEIDQDGGIDNNDYFANLGVTWEEDVQETADVIRSSGVDPDWLIVDHYALDRRWESQLRGVVGKILVVDDIANRPHDCDLLLDENPSPDLNRIYRSLVSKDARILLGPKYALLKPEFVETRKRIRPRDGRIGRIIIFYGSVDSTNETGKAMEALIALGRDDICVDVVIGSANPHRETVQTLIGQLPGATLHIQLPHLANLMGEADFAFGAGGSAIWELICLGVPVAVTTTADNQVPSIRHLAEKGLVNWLGAAGDVGVNEIKAGLEETFEETERLRLQSEACMRIVDGKGIDRVVGELV